MLKQKLPIIKAEYLPLLLNGIASRKEEDLEHERILQHYLTYSNIKHKDELEKYLLRDVDTWLTPDEAIQFGLADVVEPIRKRA